MTVPRFYGASPPGVKDSPLPGRLIVIEGTDGVGRSTHISLLKEWLESRGFPVVNTGLRRSELAGRGIERAKRGNTLDPLTLNLLYATDFADRMERQILPALRAGMVALVDRYIFSLMARARVRGLSAEWIENLYGFALVPDLVVYLDIDIEHLVPRVLSTTGFDYWESGQDYLPGPDVYRNFVEHQTRLLAEFRRLAVEHAFTTVDARGSVAEVFDVLCRVIEPLVQVMATCDAVADPPMLELP
ncbi:MAG: thymidylate kinase [Chloroflexi bacterium]|nr:thymidylate kinase [Chloroflexota bacterium]